MTPFPASLITGKVPPLKIFHWPKLEEGKHVFTCAKNSQWNVYLSQWTCSKGRKMVHAIHYANVFEYNIWIQERHDGYKNMFIPNSNLPARFTFLNQFNIYSLIWKNDGLAEQGSVHFYGRRTNSITCPGTLLNRVPGVPDHLIYNRHEGNYLYSQF